MKNWVKINNDVFLFETLAIQTSIGSHVTTNISFDISKHPSYDKKLINLYEGNVKFDLETNTYRCLGSLIKSIDIDMNTLKMSLSVRSDILYVLDTQERRDEIIDEVLNETLQNKNNIN